MHTNPAVSLTLKNNVFMVVRLLCGHRLQIMTVFWSGLDANQDDVSETLRRSLSEGFKIDTFVHQLYPLFFREGVFQFHLMIYQPISLG